MCILEPGLLVPILSEFKFPDKTAGELDDSVRVRIIYIYNNFRSKAWNMYLVYPWFYKWYAA